MVQGLTDEDHRHRCEVRQVLRWTVEHGGAWVQAWLLGMEQKRGKPAADRLRADCRAQWAKGSKGEPGIWL